MYEQAGKRLDVQIRDKRLSVIEPNEHSRESAVAFLKSRGWSEGTLLLGVNINAGSLSLERRWPLDHWRSLIESLLECYDNMLVVLTGSSSEQYYYTNVRHVRKRLLELFSILGRVFVLLKPLDAMTVPFLNGGDLQVILGKKGDEKS